MNQATTLYVTVRGTLREVIIIIIGLDRQMVDFQHQAALAFTGTSPHCSMWTFARLHFFLPPLRSEASFTTVR